MSRSANARTNVQPFRTAEWYARERAKKRLKQLYDEANAIQAWLDSLEEEVPIAVPAPPINARQRLMLRLL